MCVFGAQGSCVCFVVFYVMWLHHLQLADVEKAASRHHTILAFCL